jgi:hypothetical protein
VIIYCLATWAQDAIILYYGSDRGHSGSSHSALCDITTKAADDKGLDASSISVHVKTGQIGALDFARSASVGQHLRVLVETGCCTNRVTAGSRLEVLQKSLLGHFTPHEMRASRQCF